MKKRNLLLLAVVTFTLLYLAFRQIDFRTILQIISSRKTILAGFLFLLSCIVQFVLRALRWKILLKKYKPEIAFTTLFNSTLLGFFISYSLPGRLGEIFRPLYLAGKEKISKSQTLATVVLERILDAFFIFIIFLFSLPLISSQMENILLRKLFLLVLAGALIIICFFLLLEVIFRRQGETGLRRPIGLIFFFLPARWRERVIMLLTKFVGALRFDLSRPDLLKYILLTILFQLCIVPFYWILNLGFEGMKLSFPQIAVYFMFIYIAAAVPTPGMAGTWDFASRFALTQIFQVNAEVAIAYTLYAHFLVILFPLVGGLIVFWKEGLSWKKVRRVGGEDALS